MTSSAALLAHPVATDVVAFEEDRDTGDGPDGLNLAAYGIGPAEIALLDDLGALISPHMDRVLEGFYKGVRLSPDLNKFFPQEGLYEHARTRQKTHWQRMMASNIRASRYAKSCDVIGATHFRIGLPFEHYMAAYARIGSELQRIILRSRQGFGRRGARRIEALSDLASRMIVMDMERAVSAFFRAQREAETDRMMRLSRALEKDIGSVAEEVSAASVELASTSSQMVGTGNAAQQEAAGARKSADEMAGHVQGVASAVEELSASIAQISDQLCESTALSGKARTGAQNAGVTVQELDKAVGDIGTVLELISSIAKQTNLLALNATVEAARSGEAGRGFAVVALEIKSLSERISGATREINDRIGAIRKRTSEAVAGTGQIVEAITALDTTTSAISHAVAQQKEATQDIATSAEITAGRTSQMADAMTAVDRAVAEIAGASKEVAAAANALQGQASHLRATTETFADNMAQL